MGGGGGGVAFSPGFMMQFFVSFPVLINVFLLVAVGVLCLFLKVPWVGMQCAIVAFPGHTHSFGMYPLVSKLRL